VARLVPHKGQDVVLRALAALAPRYGRLRYLIVGDGPHAPALRQQAHSLGIAERVVFAGALPDADVAEAYATADIYVGLSRHHGLDVEGFGISFVEAGASGLAAIAGDSGGVRSAVRDGETALVVPPTDDAAVAAAIATLLDDPDRRRRMGQAGRHAVETHYNWDRVARETEAFTERVVAAARERGA
jgi:phosphatidyl-myo-inositol dimannoside synthase